MMENVNLLGHNNSFGPGSLSPMKGNMASMIDDNKSLNNSMMRRGPRAVGMKFSTSFTTEGDIIAAKERLTTFSKKNWSVISTSDSVLAYTDKKSLNLSK